MRNRHQGPEKLQHLVGKALFHNGPLKLLCLVLAYLTWQAVRENTSFEIVVADIPVKVIAADGLAVLEQTAPEVSIRFRGARDDIRFVSRDQVAVTVDLSTQPGRLRQTVKFTPRLVKAPSRAQAVQFDPPEITISMDRHVERVLPVRAILEGSLPDGVRLEKAVCEPAAVTVRGAEQLVRELELVQTVPISLEGRNSTFKTHAAVASGGRMWSVSPERVMVELHLIEPQETRQLENLALRVQPEPDRDLAVRMEPERVRVVLSGSARRIQQMSDRDVFAYVDGAALTGPADYELAVRIQIPPGIRVDRIDPATVKVNVKHR